MDIVFHDWRPDSVGVAASVVISIDGQPATLGQVDRVVQVLNNDEEVKALLTKRVEARNESQSQSAVAGPPWSDVAASAYRAYAASTGNRNYQGLPMPAFGDLPQPIRTAWEATVRQAGDVLRGGSYGLNVEQRWAGWTPPEVTAGG